MPGYIILSKLTQQAVANIKQTPERIGQNKALAESMGVKHVGTWVTLGEYDMVTVVDAPDDQTLAAFVLALAVGGNATTQTMRAFSERETAEIVVRLP